MWKPDVQGRGKIQKAFRNGESNNSASELELVLSTMGPGDRQGAVGLCAGVRNKARLHFRHQMGLCSNTGGGGGEKGGEPELVVGPHFRCSRPCPSTATLLVLTSLIPGTSRGTASMAAALGSVLHPADLTSVTMLWMSLCSCNSTVRPASGVPCHPAQDLSCNATTHEQAVGCCSNTLSLKSC